MVATPRCFPAMPSSVIRSTRYDSARRILTVRFVSGRVYAYAGVPRPVYAAFQVAPSKGRFFNAHIRNVYHYREQTVA